MKRALLSAGLFLAAATDAAAAPMPRLRGGSGRSSVCRPAEGHPFPRCRASAASTVLVEPHALWGAEIKASGCPEAARGALSARLEVAAGLFNTGVLRAQACNDMQLFAQRGGGCEATNAEWDKYLSVQRSLFAEVWQKRVRAELERCPPAERGAPPSRKRTVVPRAATCVDALPDAAPGGCEPMPLLRDERPTADELMHADMQACPDPVRAQTRMTVFSAAANFKAGLALCRVAADFFLAAQDGEACAETLAAYERHAKNQREFYGGHALRGTAETGAACRAARPSYK